MRAARYSLLLAAALAFGGCYHVRVETGRPAGQTVVDRPFALGFVYGLVPPPTLNVASECPGGVAIVETEMSFVNGLVSALTAGILTPWHIKVTCASGGSSALPSDLPEVAIAPEPKTSDVQDAFKDAADMAVASGEPVLVRFQ